VERKNRIRTCSVVAATLCAAIPIAAHAECSAEDIISYAQSATPDQFQALCGQPAQAQVAAICVTRWSVCQLATLLPAGGSCACYSQQGIIPGIAR
jgi:hypothetical protein